MKICHYVSRQNVFHYFLYLIHIFIIIIILLFYSSTVQVIKIPLAKATTILAVSRYQNIVFTSVYLKREKDGRLYTFLFVYLWSNQFKHVLWNALLVANAHRYSICSAQEAWNMKEQKIENGIRIYYHNCSVLHSSQMCKKSKRTSITLVFN